MKEVLVTGGSSGIGLALSQRLLDLGHHVTILSRNASECELSKLENARVLDVDISNIEQVREALAALTHLDILVNCAGIGYGTPIEALTEEVFDRFMDVNVKGMFFLSQTCLPLMKTGGLICNISSIAGIRGFTEWSTYCATKFAVEGFSKALREEVRPRGIRVMVVRPGAVDTPLYDFLNDSEKADFMTPESIADVVVPALFLDEKACVEEIFINNSRGDI